MLTCPKQKMFARKENDEDKIKESFYCHVRQVNISILVTPGKWTTANVEPSLTFSILIF